MSRKIRYEIKRATLLVLILVTLPFIVFVILPIDNNHGPLRIELPGDHCPIYHYPKYLATLRNSVRMEHDDFTPDDCWSAGGDLLIGPAYSNKWIRIENEDEISAYNGEYYFLRCVKGDSTRDTVVLLPKMVLELPEEENQTWDNPNVIMLLFDAVSREQFKVLFPKTVQYLEKYLTSSNSNHEGIIYSRYQVTGENSYPNKVSIYANKILDVDQLLEEDFIWNYAESNNFLVTHLDGECGTPNDTLEHKVYETYPHGSAVGIYGNLFKKRPNIHIQYPSSAFCDQVIRELNVNRCQWDTEWENITIGTDTKNGFVPICAGERNTFEMGLQYVVDTLRLHPDRKHFVTATFLEYHQTGWALPQFDEALMEFLEYIFDSYKHIAVFLMSDHGIHYGAEFDHDFGRLHTRLPLLFPIIPKTLPAQMKENLVRNHDKLTSHLDLHLALRHMINITGYSPPPGSRGTSLFSKIELQRNCEEIGIPMIYCLCHPTG